MSNIKELLKVSHLDVEKVRKLYNKCEKDIENDLKELRNWLIEQEHLPQNISDAILERLLLRNKFNLERTKLKLEAYCTLRGSYPDFFKSYDFENESLKISRENYSYTPMPILTPNQERIYVFKILEKNSDNFNFEDLCTCILAVLDLALNHDYSIGDRCVIDMSKLTLGLVFKVSPVTLKKIFKLHQQAYSARIAGLEFINTSSYMNIILSLLRPIFKAKIMQRISIHKNLESLHKNVSKSCLPSDFGGELNTFEHYHKEWNKELRNQTEFLAENSKLVSDETKRVRSGKWFHIF